MPQAGDHGITHPFPAYLGETKPWEAHCGRHGWHGAIAERRPPVKDISPAKLRPDLLRHAPDVAGRFGVFPAEAKVLEEEETA